MGVGKKKTPTAAESSLVVSAGFSGKYRAQRQNVGKGQKNSREEGEGRVLQALVEEEKGNHTTEGKIEKIKKRELLWS